MTCDLAEYLLHDVEADSLSGTVSPEYVHCSLFFVHPKIILYTTFLATHACAYMLLQL